MAYPIYSDGNLQKLDFVAEGRNPSRQLGLMTITFNVRNQADLFLMLGPTTVFCTVLRSPNVPRQAGRMYSGHIPHRYVPIPHLGTIYIYIYIGKYLTSRGTAKLVLFVDLARLFGYVALMGNAVLVKKIGGHLAQTREVSEQGLLYIQGLVNRFLYRL